MDRVSSGCGVVLCGTWTEDVAAWQATAHTQTAEQFSLFRGQVGKAYSSLVATVTSLGEAFGMDAKETAATIDLRTHPRPSRRYLTFTPLFDIPPSMFADSDYVRPDKDFVWPEFKTAAPQPTVNPPVWYSPALFPLGEFTANASSNVFTIARDGSEPYCYTLEGLQVLFPGLTMPPTGRWRVVRQSANPERAIYLGPLAPRGR